jgi:phage head maturation protease
MGENGEFNAAPIRFTIFTRQWNDDKREWEGSSLKAMRDPDGTMRLKGTASSTIKDLHGDNMLTTALEDMERAANNNLTIFGNHSYQVPEDVYGSVEAARLKAANTVDDAGDPIYDLDFNIRINDENDRAVKTWKAIDKQTKLGLSIGAMIPPGGAVRDKKSGALTIAHVELLETSIVGIPANPRSWIENAVKAFDSPTTKAATTMPVGNPQLTLDADAGTYRIEGRLDGINLSAEDVETMTASVEEPEAVVADGEPEILDAACPDCGHGKGDGGGCQNSFHKDVEPDVTDAKIRVIEVDTGDDSGSSSQEASPSEPAPAVEADETDGTGDVMADATDIITTAETVMAGLEPEVTTMLQQLLDLTNGLTRELAASVEREQKAMAAKAVAEQQRDEIATLATSLMEGTSAILNKLADQPVGRRTVYREAADQFGGLEGIYSRDFLTMLRSKK